MEWTLSESPEVNEALRGLLEQYRARYLSFFLDRFLQCHHPGYRGGYFNINSVTGEPYPHDYCYSWTDGRSLGELAASHLTNLGDRETIRAYCDHLCECLLERYECNGYFPHVVADDTNLAAADPMNVPISAGGSSYSHVFCLNGLYQHGLVFGVAEAEELALRLLGNLTAALQNDRFLEGAKPRPSGQRAQGPFMISLGALVDILETMSALFGRKSATFAERSEPLIGLGRYCVEEVLASHHRPSDSAFWEVSENGEAVRDVQGRVITDPGHTIEFTGFAARFAALMDRDESAELRQKTRAILLWAARNGFHPERDLVYKSIDRDSGRPTNNEHVNDISQVVSEQVFQGHFGGRAQAVDIATFPWWVPMELIAAGSLLRHGDETGEVDRFILRAIRGIFEYYRNERIGGLCYQNIGDGFFDWIDIPPATASLDLMHSHRSMRIFLREALGAHAEV